MLLGMGRADHLRVCLVLLSRRRRDNLLLEMFRHLLLPLLTLGLLDFLLVLLQRRLDKTENM